MTKHNNKKPRLIPKSYYEIFSYIEDVENDAEVAIILEPGGQKVTAKLSIVDVAKGLHGSTLIAEAPPEGWDRFLYYEDDEEEVL